MLHTSISGKRQTNNGIAQTDFGVISKLNLLRTLDNCSWVLFVTSGAHARQLC